MDATPADSFPPVARTLLRAIRTHDAGANEMCSAPARGECGGILCLLMQGPESSRTGGADRRPTAALVLGLHARIRRRVGCHAGGGARRGVSGRSHTRRTGPGSDRCVLLGAPWVNVGPIDELSYPVENELGPDTNVAYYYTRFQLPAGASVVLSTGSSRMRGFSRSRPTSARTASPATRRHRSTTNRSTPIRGRSTHSATAKTAMPAAARTRSRSAARCLP